MPRIRRFEGPGDLLAAGRRELQRRAVLGAMEVGFARAARGSDKIVVGPWLSEVGFELLYWVPMVRNLLARRSVDRSRVVAVSRGGPASWYSDFAAEYVDTLTLFDGDEYGRWQDVRRTESNGEKQLAVTTFDKLLLERLRERIGTASHGLLHPLMMYQTLREYWRGGWPVSRLARHAEYRRLSAPPRSSDASSTVTALPREYVAAKPYFSSCFPPTESNREFTRRLLLRLSEALPVVLLSPWPGEGADGVPPTDAIIDCASSLDPATNLDVQTELIAGAAALVSTYGGFSYLGPLVGARTYTYYSRADFNHRHLDVLRFASERIGEAGYAVLHRRDIDLLHRLLRGATTS